jgi:ATP-binding cassette subfamily B protein
MAIRGIWFHIESNKKKKFYVVFILTLFTSILEVLSIGSIIPFLNVITNQNYIKNIENVLPPYLQILEIQQEYLIYFITAFFIFSILTTNILRILTLKYLTYLSHEIGSDLSIKIYRKAIYQSYESHTLSNSSNLIDAIVNKSSLSIYFVNLLIILLNSFTILSFLIVSTVYISPFISILSIIIIGLIYYNIAVNNKISLNINGQIISFNSKKIQQHLQEGFGSIREILLSSSQEIFCNIYSKSEIQLRKAQASNIIIGMYPRFIMETVGIVLITLYALVMLVFSDDQQSNNSTLAFIGALALAAQRTLPLIQQVYSSWAGLSGANDSITELINYLN